MKKGDNVISLVDYAQFEKFGVIHIPFTPNKDTICTVREISALGLLVDETSAYTPFGKELTFNEKVWRVIDLPTVDFEELVTNEELITQ